MARVRRGRGPCTRLLACARRGAARGRAAVASAPSLARPRGLENARLVLQLVNELVDALDLPTALARCRLGDGDVLQPRRRIDAELLHAPPLQRLRSRRRAHCAEQRRTGMAALADASRAPTFFFAFMMFGSVA